MTRKYESVDFFFKFTQHFFNLGLRHSLFSLKSELAQGTVAEFSDVRLIV